METWLTRAESRVPLLKERETVPFRVFRRLRNGSASLANWRDYIDDKRRAEGAQVSHESLTL